jgi:hypothetical protein
VRRGDSVTTLRDDGQNEPSLLEDVFLDGRLLREERWEQICDRAELSK